MVSGRGLESRIRQRRQRQNSEFGSHTDFNRELRKRALKREAHGRV